MLFLVFACVFIISWRYYHITYASTHTVLCCPGIMLYKLDDVKPDCENSFWALLSQSLLFPCIKATHIRELKHVTVLEWQNGHTVYCSGDSRGSHEYNKWPNTHAFRTRAVMPLRPSDYWTEFSVYWHISVKPDHEVFWSHHVCSSLLKFVKWYRDVATRLAP